MIRHKAVVGLMQWIARASVSLVASCTSGVPNDEGAVKWIECGPDHAPENVKYTVVAKSIFFKPD